MPGWSREAHQGQWDISNPALKWAKNKKELQVDSSVSVTSQNTAARAGERRQLPLFPLFGAKGLSQGSRESAPRAVWTPLEERPCRPRAPFSALETEQGPKWW